MNIRVEKVGGIWHGTIDGQPDVDVRGLTEDVARRKVLAIAKQLEVRSDDVNANRPENDDLTKRIP